MKIYFASDHGGFQVKEQLKNYLKDEGYEIVDFGNDHYDSGDDYPQFVFPLAKEVALTEAQGEGAFGIILGRSGNGEAMAANKVKGVRAALCLNPEMAKKARDHNNANVLSIGADYVNFLTAKSLVDVFIKTPFSFEERHRRRVRMITEYESSKS